MLSSQSPSLHVKLTNILLLFGCTSMDVVLTQEAEETLHLASKEQYELFPIHCVDIH